MRQCQYCYWMGRQQSSVCRTGNLSAAIYLTRWCYLAKTAREVLPSTLFCIQIRHWPTVSCSCNVTPPHQHFSSLTYSCFSAARLLQQIRQHLNLIWNRIPEHQWNIHHSLPWYLVSSCTDGWAWFGRAVNPLPLPTLTGSSHAWKEVHR